MKRALILAVGVVTGGVHAAPPPQPNGYTYDPAVGWHWYNEPKKPKDKQPPPGSPSSPTPESATETLRKLSIIRDELRNQAVLEGTPESVRRYKVMQDYLVDKATKFSATWDRVLLENPELDYSLQHPYYNGTAPLEYQKERQAQNAAIRYVNQRYGVFFFYRGNEPLDNKLGEVIKEFSVQYGIPVIPITVDGRVNPDLPESKQDTGQAGKMGIKHFPAVYLVEPGKKTFKPLAYGFITQDDLARRMLNVVTDFKPRF
ncbi:MULTISPECIES: type-F conjugative transfer system pilin assembly protein TraF [Serratia]|jgi:conjugal transfer pilus assembly protein TraF|uniref:type-F conjugative transfer system pilin assembly protein TraF n=1 Tax=Serratia TaxID=613 RepID=UPI001F4BEB7B|nr:type-F conjugative transfer system pilin assembly protein TraF [Serratia proteamaculans]ULG15834.1 type-F conjugative transfer system pilin assembly protein TraF [Serratia proteamaculans]